MEMESTINTVIDIVKVRVLFKTRCVNIFCSKLLT